jgi:hypothetical protein
LVRSGLRNNESTQPSAFGGTHATVTVPTYIHAEDDRQRKTDDQRTPEIPLPEEFVGTAVFGRVEYLKEFGVDR